MVENNHIAQSIHNFVEAYFNKKNIDQISLEDIKHSITQEPYNTALRLVHTAKLLHLQHNKQLPIHTNFDKELVYNQFYFYNTLWYVHASNIYQQYLNDNDVIINSKAKVLEIIQKNYQEEVSKTELKANPIAESIDINDNKKNINEKQKIQVIKVKENKFDTDTAEAIIVNEKKALITEEKLVKTDVINLIINKEDSLKNNINNKETETLKKITDADLKQKGEIKRVEVEAKDYTKVINANELKQEDNKTNDNDNIFKGEKIVAQSININNEEANEKKAKIGIAKVEKKTNETLDKIIIKNVEEKATANPIIIVKAADDDIKEVIIERIVLENIEEKSKKILEIKVAEIINQQQQNAEIEKVEEKIKPEIDVIEQGVETIKVAEVINLIKTIDNNIVTKSVDIEPNINVNKKGNVSVATIETKTKDGLNKIEIENIAEKMPAKKLIIAEALNTKVNNIEPIIIENATPISETKISKIIVQETKKIEKTEPLSLKNIEVKIDKINPISVVQVNPNSILKKEIKIEKAPIIEQQKTNTRNQKISTLNTKTLDIKTVEKKQEIEINSNVEVANNKGSINTIKPSKNKNNVIKISPLSTIKAPQNIEPIIEQTFLKPLPVNVNNNIKPKAFNEWLSAYTNKEVYVELKVVEEKKIYTETMANLYIKQNNIEQAIFIYEQLILANPQKKSYFAKKIETLTR